LNKRFYSKTPAAQQASDKIRLVCFRDAAKYCFPDKTALAKAREVTADDGL